MTSNSTLFGATVTVVIALLVVSGTAATALGAQVPPTSSMTVDFVAGKNLDVGDVTVTQDTENLYITYTTTGGWYLIETHLYVGDSLADLPTTKRGNPVPRLLPHNSTHLATDTVTSHTYTIPLSTYFETDAVIDIAAHAAVVNPAAEREETAWADGERIVSRGNWATAFAYDLTVLDTDGDDL